MLNFWISNLNLGIFASSLGESSLRPWVVIPKQALGGDAGSDIDKLLLRCLGLKDNDFCITLPSSQADL